MKTSRSILICSMLLFFYGIGLSTKAGAWKRYKYCEKHSCKDGCYRDHRIWQLRNNSHKTYDAADAGSNKEMTGKYYHTYKNYDRHDDKGYVKYYDDHNKIYYNKGYDDNYRPQVDANKH